MRSHHFGNLRSQTPPPPSRTGDVELSSREHLEYAHVVILGGNDIKNGAKGYRRQRIADGIRANVNPAFEYDEPVEGLDSTAEIDEFIEASITVSTPGKSVSQRLGPESRLCCARKFT